MADQIMLHDARMVLSGIGNVLSDLYLSPDAIALIVVLALGGSFFWLKSKLGC